MSMLHGSAALILVLALSVRAADIFIRPQNCAFNITMNVADSYRQVVNISVAQCAANCLGDGISCRSFSYFQDPVNTTTACQLNLGVSDAYWTGLVYAVSWTYYERVPETSTLTNFGIANVATCTPNTFRDCHQAGLVSPNSATYTQQIYLQLDNNTHPIIGNCYNGEFVFMNRTGQFYDISWNRNWEDYVYGFGNGLGNYWTGLDLGSRLTQQDMFFQNGGNCIQLRQLNGTTTRLAIGSYTGYVSTSATKCPWWSVRRNGYGNNPTSNLVVLTLRSLCICEDVNTFGHVALCGCSEPNRNQFFYNFDQSMIMSRNANPGIGNRCLRAGAWQLGQEVAIADCNAQDGNQIFNPYYGRYRMEYVTWDVWGTYNAGTWVEAQILPYTSGYTLQGYSINGCACNGGVGNNYNWRFSTYDNDQDSDGSNNIANRLAGGWWWYQMGWCNGGEPRLTAQRDTSTPYLCGYWLQNMYLWMPTDNYYY